MVALDITIPVAPVSGTEVEFAKLASKPSLLLFHLRLLASNDLPIALTTSMHSTE